MSSIEIVLLLMGVCLLLLVLMVVAGAFLLARLIFKLSLEVKALKTAFDKEFLPVIDEAKSTLGSLRELINALRNSVGNLAFMFMVGKGAPKLLKSIAGIKMGMDVALKLYKQFYKKNDKNTNKSEV
ncbi:MAG TPA: hypothetical protein DEA47_05700 [Peptococcaceae bacterium]|nr:MAG: hypothetical protein XD50_0770 [Clostridia bacterium 41_269]HBT20835.1 hypothetical protein [Peptococcaceae bacterium]